MTTQTKPGLGRSDSAEATQENIESVSVIDRHSHFDGLYRTACDLRIEGSVEGEIECEGTITVAEDAMLAAKVQAKNVIVAGTAEGEINCSQRFTIQPTGDMRGQVVAQSLVVEEGAFFEGQFEMTDSRSSGFSSATDGWSNGYTPNNKKDTNNHKKEDWSSLDGNKATGTEETSEDDEEDATS